VIVTQYSIKIYGFIDDKEILKSKPLLENKTILLNKIFSLYKKLPS